MAYPFTTAGGGITNVSWGDITGTLSDQTDLQAALDGKQDISEPLMDVSDSTFWQSRPGPTWEEVSWTGDAWDLVDPPTESSGGQIRLDATGGWNTGLQPSQMIIVLSIGASGGSYTSARLMVEDSENHSLDGTDGDGIPIPFEGWSKTVTMTVDLEESPYGFDMSIIKIDDVRGASISIHSIKLVL